jgi:hypothetical protein
MNPCSGGEWPSHRVTAPRGSSRAGTFHALERAQASRYPCPLGRDETMLNLLWGVAAVLFVLWLLGLAFHVVGGVIHVLLVLAVVSVVARLVMGSRSA